VATTSQTAGRSSQFRGLGPLILRLIGLNHADFDLAEPESMKFLDVDVDVDLPSTRSAPVSAY
jgi:hypothetical protein